MVVDLHDVQYSSTPFPAAVGRTIGGPQRNAFSISPASDRGLGALKLQAHHARRRIALASIRSSRISCGVQGSRERRLYFGFAFRGALLPMGESGRFKAGCTIDTSVISQWTNGGFGSVAAMNNLESRQWRSQRSPKAALEVDGRPEPAVK